MTPPEPSLDDVARIARGLTKAQRHVVVSLLPGERRMIGLGSDPELLEPVGINHPIFGAHYRLTPLGIAVRQRLISQDE